MSNMQGKYHNPYTISPFPILLTCYVNMCRIPLKIGLSVVRQKQVLYFICWSVDFSYRQKLPVLADVKSNSLLDSTQWLMCFSRSRSLTEFLFTSSSAFTFSSLLLDQWLGLVLSISKVRSLIINVSVI